MSKKVMELKWRFVSERYDDALPKIIDVDWLADVDGDFPLCALVEYEGQEYDVILSYELWEGYNIKTDCPFFSKDSNELLWHRCEDFHQRAQDFYMKKYFRISEKEEKVCSDYPVIVGAKTCDIAYAVYREGVPVKRVCILYFQDRFIRRYIFTVDNDFEEYIDSDQDNQAIGFEYGREEELEKRFFDEIMDIVHTYKEKLQGAYLFLEKIWQMTPDARKSSLFASL